MAIAVSGFRSLAVVVMLIAIANFNLADESTVNDTKGTNNMFDIRKGCPPGEGVKIPPGRVNSTKQLADLRRLMARKHHSVNLPVDAYIITSNDEHQSEYLAPWDRRREFVSGFSGSNGLAVVTAKRAALWTDGRYVLQADEQLDCNWELMTRQDIADWLAQELHEGARVGVDANLVSHHAWNTLEHNLGLWFSAMLKTGGKDSCVLAVNTTISPEEDKINLSKRWRIDKDLMGIHLVDVSKNLVDSIWHSTKPNATSYQAFVHNESFAGLDWTVKVGQVRSILRSIDVDAMVVTSLEEVAWLFNIRGYDLQFTPVIKAYAILSLKEIYLFTHESKITKEIRKHLRMNACFNELCVRLKPYEDILSEIRIMTQRWNKVLLPAPCTYDQGVSQAVFTAVHPPEKRHLQISPILLLKARKNHVESYGMRVAHIRDAAAFCSFMAYFEKKMADGHTWTETEAAEEIDRFRGEQRHCKGPSFATIVGYGPNGALPHYSPSNATNLVIGNNSTLVIDSGGQYLDGTTDVTRTFHFGNPTEFEKEVYTRVLIGSIQLATLVFPSSVKMTDVDVLARGPLWEAGLDYNHGTGHGIGSFLGVHESPINVIYYSGNFTFQKGYFFSDEPGYYEENEFGVRLENILEVEERPTKHGQGVVYYGFRPVTLIPYETKLMNMALLSKEHRDWLNNYNNQIRIKVGEELKRQRRMPGFRWMMAKTGYIPDYCASSSVLSSSVSAITLVFVSHILSYAYISYSQPSPKSVFFQTT